MTFRSDGLDNPLSPNSGGLTWQTVERAAEASEAVQAWQETQRGVYRIDWCDGTQDTFREPLEALNAIRAMEAN